MTSKTDMAGHPDVAEISDLADGLLSPSRTADVRRHLDDCPLCTEVYDSLAEIRSLLGTLPGPARMPADVSGRIDAALAAAALLTATTPPSDFQMASDDRANVSRETSTVGAFGASPDTSSSSPGDRPSGRSRAATGPGRAHRAHRGHHRAAVIGTVFTAAALGLGAILSQSTGGYGTGNSSQSTAPLESGSTVTFSEATLKTHVSELLEKGQPTADPPGSGGSWRVESHDTGSASHGVGTLITPAVPDCVREGTGNDGAVLAAEEGTYNGTSVYLVVQPHPSDTTRVTAYIVDAACVKQASAAGGKLLLSQSYTQP